LTEAYNRRAMGNATIETRVRTPEQQAAHEAALARQKAIFENAFAEEAWRREERESRFNESLATREIGEVAVVDDKQIKRNPEAVYIDINSVVNNALAMEAVDSKPTTKPDARVIYEEIDDEILYSIPSFPFPGRSNEPSVRLEYDTDDETVFENGQSYFNRTESHLTVQLEQFANGDYYLEMIDRDEREMTKLRLSGYLRQVESIPDRFVYFDNPSVSLHPNALNTTRQSLEKTAIVIEQNIHSNNFIS